MRLPVLLFGIVTLPLLFLLVKKTNNQSIALLAVALLALNPWHIMISHWALESNLLPFFLVLGALLLSISDGGRRRWWSPLSLAVFSLSLYTYALAVIPVLFILGMYVVSNYREVWINKRKWLVAFFAGCIVAFPWEIFFIKNMILHHTLYVERFLPFTAPLLSESRLEQTGGGNVILNNLRFFASGMTDHTPWNTIEGFLPIPAIFLCFALVGCFAIIMHRQKTKYIYIFWVCGTLAYIPLANLNINRANAILIPLIVLAAQGIYTISKQLDLIHARAFITACITSMAIITSLFYIQYTSSDYRSAVAVTMAPA